MFKETFEFKNAIIFYYGKQKFVALQQKVLKTQIWVITKGITSTLNPIIFTCVMKHSKGHQLLLDALTTTITLIM